MSWEADGSRWIGEIKVTRYLSVDEAFRTALGQLLVYANTQFSAPPTMVMFLDRIPREALLRLAERLSIAVVVESASGAFALRTVTSSSELERLFPPQE